MKGGHARVSRKDQKLEPQHDDLLANVCEKVFEEKISSREVERKSLQEAFDYSRKGDVLVVAGLDRQSRLLRELTDQVGQLEQRGVGFRSLKESLDTTTVGRIPIFHVFGALAEFEQEIIRERTMAGLESTRSQVQHDARREQGKARPTLKAKRDHPLEEICSMLGIGSFYATSLRGGQIVSISTSTLGLLLSR